MAGAVARIGVIGGSGLYRMADLTDVDERQVDTPFGPPSDAITIGTLAGARVAFLPRHGIGHRLAPAAVPVRANFWALKSLGVERVISVSAVGSMREELAPLDLVVPDQLFDRTAGRPRTFFDEGAGCVVHVSLAEPFCPELRPALVAAAGESGARVHDGGTYICIEGPQFSTRGESRIFRSWGVDVIGMTAFPEARLAREAELCYATLALVTDYDVWKADEEPVSVQLVIERLGRNAAAAQATLRALVPRLVARRGCTCGSALRDAIITDPARIPPATRDRLGLLLDRYLP
ncbi:MAG: 5'-methylthioadenosine phosphorylase [uncultured Thermomicrobiales bacterium]|uniref:S-methyl-5'-thioadenosine phosphorylase n=1 Tax=uncultured Thermomicrobiales bacterium TaxID=1645740 RepID=A0A6J4VS45_9BACT|nr:MAG: 5'-methylthioadenosine phosphorylase [uncultured Thermomicrobiales bacterium]